MTELLSVPEAADSPAETGEAPPTPRERQILLACAQLLASDGHERLTIDAVAARAKASKATIYRRWPGKAPLVFAAVQALSETEPFAAVYTGDLRADMIAVSTGVRDRIVASGPLLAGMLYAMQRDPELAQLMRENIRRSQASVAELIERYLADGAIDPSVDHEIVRQVAPSTVITRLLFTDEPVDDTVIARLVDHVLLPLLTGAK
ncbi:MAG: TetR/AcrR family transcriptional regulator [Sporichthyaceae bacterium]